MEARAYEISLELLASGAKDPFGKRTRAQRRAEEDFLSCHQGPERKFLPEVLARVTHDGNSGKIPPTTGVSANGDMHPRRLHDPSRPPRPQHVLNHLNMYKRTRTPFLSFGTWSCVSSRIARWEELGVRNMKLHVILTSRLPDATMVLRSTDWADKHSYAGAKPYHRGEYLIRGKIPASSFLLSGVSVCGIPSSPRSNILPWSPRSAAINWIETGISALSLVWSYMCELKAKPYGPFREHGLAVSLLLGDMFLDDHLRNIRIRQETFANPIEALLDFFTAQGVPRIVYRRKLLESGEKSGSSYVGIIDIREGTDIREHFTVA